MNIHTRIITQYISLHPIHVSFHNSIIQNSTR